MTADRRERNHRVLVIDDTAEIHTVFRRLLSPKRSPTDLDRLESTLFGPDAVDGARADASFSVDSALQGEQGLAMVRDALAEGRPYAMAFVDMRMPPGWDGLQTIEAVWAADRDLEVVICTAFSDYTDRDIVERLGPSDQLLFLRKPFDAMDARQIARALTEKWSLRKRSRSGDAASGSLTAAASHELARSLQLLALALGDARRRAQAEPADLSGSINAITSAIQTTGRLFGLVHGLAS